MKLNTEDKDKFSADWCRICATHVSRHPPVRNKIMARVTSSLIAVRQAHYADNIVTAILNWEHKKIL